MTHPDFLDAIAHQRQLSLRRSATTRTVRPHTRRERLGWLLVGWGLRLAAPRPARFSTGASVPGR
ncbi:hypothetical protein [Prauserella cavernicola]|uniref:Uncharacterized protein n=1 Tax=Prauserella cavernicola TaxID=2800127 RepID=A0A934QP62_9PSEU|nr:hypothetical protein [Prauserella cavernicola]MBK1785647.1 hypothetical protein [Prauserella cavernicola]